MNRRTERQLWSYVIRLAFIMVFALGLTQTGWAWGGTGHRLIAGVAAKMIAPSTREEVDRLLEGKSMADVALWADQIKKERPETAPWHYVKFSAAREWEESTPVLDGPNILTAVSELTDRLRNSGLSDSERREALMFVIHLVGDLHQPMHCAPDGDVGGNAVSVSFFDKETNLHKVWDSYLLEELPGSEDEKLTALEQSWGDIRESDCGSADYIRWATESNQVSRRHAYLLPDNHQLGDAYVHNNLRSCSRQVWLAGVRLANLLDATLCRPDGVNLAAFTASN